MPIAVRADGHARRSHLAGLRGGHVELGGEGGLVRRHQPMEQIVEERPAHRFRAARAAADASRRRPQPDPIATASTTPLETRMATARAPRAIRGRWLRRSPSRADRPRRSSREDIESCSRRARAGRASTTTPERTRPGWKTCRGRQHVLIVIPVAVVERQEDRPRRQRRACGRVDEIGGGHRRVMAADVAELLAKRGQVERVQTAERSSPRRQHTVIHHDRRERRARPGARGHRGDRRRTPLHLAHDRQHGVERIERARLDDRRGLIGRHAGQTARDDSQPGPPAGQVSAQRFAGRFGRRVLGQLRHRLFDGRGRWIEHVERRHGAADGRADARANAAT